MKESLIEYIKYTKNMEKLSDETIDYLIKHVQKNYKNMGYTIYID